MNDPVRTVLPTFAVPQGTVAVDFTNEPDPDASTESVADLGRLVPSRGQYRVALACVGSGTIRWDIGENRLAGGGEQPCDGSALGVEIAEGVPPEDTAVLVHHQPAQPLAHRRYPRVRRTGLHRACAHGLRR